jgi:hypothetical protein
LQIGGDLCTIIPNGWIHGGVLMYLMARCVGVSLIVLYGWMGALYHCTDGWIHGGVYTPVPDSRMSGGVPMSLLPGQMRVSRGWVCTTVPDLWIGGGVPLYLISKCVRESHCPRWLDS